MKKALGKRELREQRSLQLYSPCPCGSCSPCSGTPSWNYVNNSDRKDANTSA